MSTVTPMRSVESPEIADWIPSPLFRMTLEQYETMVKSGAFSEHDRFHLINGYLAEKMTQYDPHATADELCGRALDKAIPPGGMSDRPRPSDFRLAASPNPIEASCGGQFGIKVTGHLARMTLP